MISHILLSYYRPILMFCLLIVYDDFELPVESLVDDSMYLGHHLDDIGVLEDKVSFGV